MKEWDINIYRGILTGYNEAFIIDGKKRNELINEDPKSAEIIRPILRGRDIKRYGYEFADLWLINTHNGLKEKNLKPIDVNDYPAIKKHLNFYFEKLDRRTDKGDTLYNLRNCAYTEEFHSPKLLWAETMRIHKQNEIKFPRFGYDQSGDYLTDKTCFFATGKHIKYIMAVLNSSMGKYLCSQYVSILDNGGYLMQKIFIEQIPIPNFNNQVEEKIARLIDKSYIENHIIEKEIDQIIFNEYKLSEAEIKFVNSE